MAMRKQLMCDVQWEPSKKPAGPTSDCLSFHSAKKTVYISQLPASVTEETLKTYFGQFGSVNKVFVIKDRKTGKSREFGFVEFSKVSVVPSSPWCWSLCCCSFSNNSYCVSILVRRSRKLWRQSASQTA